MKIKERKILDLKPAEYNPRQLTDKQYKQLKKSLKTFGCVEPVVVNANPIRKDIIIGGHQRCKVWADLGNNSIPTVEVELDEAQEMELNVRLNKNTGEFDIDALANFFDEDELMNWGFSEHELFQNSYDEDVDDMEEGEELDVDQSLQVLPQKEYIIIYAEKDSIDWDELKTIFKCKTVRQGGCTIGSTSDKATTGLERVFDVETFKKRLNV